MKTLSHTHVADDNLRPSDPNDVISLKELEATKGASASVSITISEGKLNDLSKLFKEGVTGEAAVQNVVDVLAETLAIAARHPDSKTTDFIFNTISNALSHIQTTLGVGGEGEEERDFNPGDLRDMIIKSLIGRGGEA